MLLYRSILALTLLVAACGPPAPSAEDAHDEGEEHREEEHAEAEASLVRLSAEELLPFGVALETAGPGSVDSGIELLGEVRPNGDRLAHIVPRYPGLVREVLRSVGDRVAAGDVLMHIESNEGLSVYPTRAQLAGTVIARDIAVGEAVDRDKQAFVIADLSTVWIDLAVYQKDLRAVQVGHRVLVLGGAGGRDADGAISYVTPVVDEPTRTAVARVVLPNPDGAWRPGTFVTARLLDPAEAKVVIPRSALQVVDGRSVVFIEVAEGFEPRPVSLGREGERSAEVLAGLAPGERFVAQNSFLLKAELGKGSAEHEH